MRESLIKAAISSNLALYELMNLPQEKKRKAYDDTTIVFYKF
jgi:hypothetical protein